MVNACRKGKAGERAVANLLKEKLGVELSRNLEQQRSGGFDLVGLPALAIEVKDHKMLKLPEWWRQAVSQAVECDRTPVLFYKVYRRGWRVRLPLVGMDSSIRLDDTMDVSVDGFCYLCRLYWLP